MERSSGSVGSPRPRGALAITWDFDSALGQVAATYPYHFRRLPLDQELAAMGELRDIGATFAAPMTFASVGFASEDISPPFGAQDVLRSLHGDGHEIASHSWRHEWLPHLTTQQLQRSLLRSKYALETLLEAPGVVRGLVPPFNRPMSWPSRGIVHPGDRWAFPFGSGTTVGRLLRTAAGAGYSWVRVSYAPHLARQRDPLRPAFRAGGATVVVNHKSGFDQATHRLLDQAVEQRRVLNVYGHPAGIFRQTNEHRDLLVALLERAASLRDAGKLDIVTVAGSLGLSDA